MRRACLLASAELLVLPAVGYVCSALTLSFIMPRIKCICSISVRLAGGSSSREGRLEVYYRGVWGTVCDDGFTDASARVVCYMLGYG